MAVYFITELTGRTSDVCIDFFLLFRMQPNMFPRVANNRPFHNIVYFPPSAILSVSVIFKSDESLF